MDRHLPLTTGWSLRAVPTGASSYAVPAPVAGAVVPATVPGCVHTDLLSAGLIPEPYVDDNELALAWIGRTEWTYRADVAQDLLGTFERVDLVCEGLDTVADVRLNGLPVGSTRNMHRTYRWDVRSQLAARGERGLDELEVHFRSAYEEAEHVRADLGDRPNAYPEPFNFIRKMACNFGWDWGPTLVTAGIWRPIGLHGWDVARLARVRPLVTVAGGVGRLAVHVDVERSGVSPARELTVRVDVAGVEAAVTVPADASSAVCVVEVPDPDLWWPHTLGEQPLHTCAVTLEDTSGAGLGTWSRRIGFRTVELDTTTTDGRSAFTFVVNGVPVFARGVNWIPDDAFPSRVDAARYRTRLEQARDANVDLVRVWGGGIYESDDFYDACDELGLLVWQDFLFACAAYPEDEPIRSEVEAEARDNVARLVPHPSLVLWNGNNENIWGFDVWGWKEPLAGRSWGEGFYYDLLPAVVAEVDPTRRYWAGSPWSGSPELPPNDSDHGCIHIWDVWNGRDYLAYREYVPPFVSEFGWQAPPTWATVRRMTSDDPLLPDSPGMLHHQKAIDGQQKLEAGLAAHFPLPVGTDDWHHLTQVTQARAIQLGVEHWRSHWPRVAGSIVWQLNDCWPVTSWAAIDGYGRRKPLWYALRQAFADRVVTVQPRGDRLVAVLVNQSSQPWQDTLALRLVELAGGAGPAHYQPVLVAPGSVLEVPVPRELATPADPGAEALVATAGDRRGLWYFAEDVELDYAEPDLRVRVSATPDGYDVSLASDVLVRDLVLQVDRLDPDAQVDDSFLTLLPGERVTLHVRSALPLDAAALGSAPVLATVNGSVLRSRALVREPA